MSRPFDEPDTKPGNWNMSVKSSVSSGETSVKQPVQCQEENFPYQESANNREQFGLMEDESLKRGAFSSSQGSSKEMNRTSSNSESGYLSMNSQNSLGRATSSLVSISPNPATDYNISYRMNHSKRGQFLIINNTRFSEKVNMGPRTGSDVDAANLYTIFKKFGFDVVLKHNLTISDMLKAMVSVSRNDHSESDCFAMAILSHGDSGCVYGTDGIIRLEALTEPIKGKNCPSLIGKPKLFFIQSCRGDELDDGVELPDAMDVSDAVPDEEEKIPKIPAEADFLYAYSTAPGYFSFRNKTKGSWFVQALMTVFEEYGTKLELMRLLTRVNREVAYKFESRSATKAHSRKKQIPSFVSMLTKELYFLEKS